MHDKDIWNSEVFILVYTLQYIVWILFKNLKKGDKDGSRYILFSAIDHFHYFLLIVILLSDET